MLHAGRNRLVWLFYLPKRGPAAAEFGSRTVRLCRRHMAVVEGFDPYFAKRYGGAEFLRPDWWAEPARPVQVDYLKRLIAARQCPADIAVCVETAGGELKRGDVCEWIEVLKFVPRRTAAELADAGVL